MLSKGISRPSRLIIAWAGGKPPKRGWRSRSHGARQVSPGHPRAIGAEQPERGEHRAEPGEAEDDRIDQRRQQVGEIEIGAVDGSHLRTLVRVDGAEERRAADRVERY